MSINKTGKVGFRPVIPEAERGKPAETRGPIFDLKNVARLLPKGEGGKVGGVFYGAPVWSDHAKKRLYGFVVSALETNKLFKDKPIALAETAEHVCKAIQNSNQLTSKFLPYLNIHNS